MAEEIHTNPTPAPSFSRPRRDRTTRKSVLVADFAARWVITVGGIGVVLAFAAIVFFIASVVLPLFRGATVSAPVYVSVEAASDGARVVALDCEENLHAAWTLDSAGMFRYLFVDTGQVVAERKLVDKPITAVAATHGKIIFGHADGTVRFGSISHEVSWINHPEGDLARLRVDSAMIHEGGVAERTPIGQIRVTKPKIELSDPVAVADGEPSPIVKVDYLATTAGEALIALREDGRLLFDSVSKRRNMLTGKVTTTLSKFELPRSNVRPIDEVPAAILLGSNARQAYLVYDDGLAVRYNLDKPGEAFVAEIKDLIPDPNRKLASIEFLLGNITLIVCDDAGGVAGWFHAPYPDDVPESDRNRDNARLVNAHTLPPQPSPVTAITTSTRDRQFITGDDAGNVFIRHMTSGTVQGKAAITATPLQAVAMAPKNDALLALDSSNQLSLVRFSNPHPDGSISEIFLPVHYEGYSEARHIWQSSAGTDDAEPKHGLVPLIFGTLKATFYSMLFAVPLAILAAIYTSEFMAPAVKNTIKPLVEMMAGLPSVVLGFVAALVLAPWIESRLASLLLAVIFVPGLAYLGGMFWQFLPPRIALAIPRWVTFAIVVALMAIAILLAFLLGPTLSQVLFGGDTRDWLGKRTGTGTFGATPGWLILLLPLALVGTTYLQTRYMRQRVRAGTVSSDRRTQAINTLIRTLFVIVGAIVAALAVGATFSALGFDIRDPVPGFEGPIAGPYVQRNSMIIGLIMGFAIIPIIYTVSEDALSSVPMTLRSAALGAGATPWQTAIRVVLPVAASGIFSACMIGFGRAAGETMIVLMAGGNTPTLDPSLFSGIRPLSANIAVELPEAPRDSTHYRILYLSALVLFLMTFVVNTVAEVVRQRFRKRAYQL